MQNVVQIIGPHCACLALAACCGRLFVLPFAPVCVGGVGATVDPRCDVFLGSTNAVVGPCLLVLHGLCSAWASPQKTYQAIRRSLDGIQGMG